jgi:hypothetical protein
MKHPHLVQEISQLTLTVHTNIQMPEIELGKWTPSNIVDIKINQSG